MRPAVPNCYWVMLDGGHIVAYMAYSRAEAVEQAASMWGSSDRSGAFDRSLLQQLVGCECGQLVDVWPEGEVWRGGALDDVDATSAGIPVLDALRGYCHGCGTYLESVVDEDIDADRMRAAIKGTRPYF